MIKEENHQWGNLEGKIRFGIMVIFSIFWIVYGAKMLKNMSLISNFISSFSDYEPRKFSWNLFFKIIIDFSLYCYPILFVWFLALTLFDRIAFRQFFTFKIAIHFLVSPLYLILAGLAYLLLIVGVRAVISIILYSIIIFFFLRWIYKWIRDR